MREACALAYSFTVTSLLEKLKARVLALQMEAHVLHIASRDPRTPWYAKALTFFMLAYIFSPFDLIPDFIPVVGYLDDILVVSMGIPLISKMIPAGVLEEARETAAQNKDRFSMLAKSGMVAVVLVWRLAAVWIVLQVYLLLSKIRG